VRVLATVTEICVKFDGRQPECVNKMREVQRRNNGIREGYYRSNLGIRGALIRHADMYWREVSCVTTNHSTMVHYPSPDSSP